MRLRSVALLCLLLAPRSGAEDGLPEGAPRTPVLIFEEPDPATRKEITRELISSKALGDSHFLSRRRARARLAEIGPWAVPFLGEAVHGKKRASSVRVRMNAVLSLALIRDPRCLDQLRAAAEKDDDLWVRHSATLAIGLFRRPADVVTLRQLLDHRNQKRQHIRSAAPALAKLKNGDAKAVLEVALQQVAAQRHAPNRYDAAAVILSAAVASPLPRVDLMEHFARKDDLIQQAVATALIIRPLPPHRHAELLDALKTTKDRRTRVLLIRALGAIRPRTDEIRTALLDVGKGGRSGTKEQIAALVELDCREADYTALYNMYKPYGARNDPVVAVLYDAMARTGSRDAVDRLMKLTRSGTDFVRYYAAAALLHAMATEKLVDRDGRIWQAISELAHERADSLQALGRWAQAGNSSKKGAELQSALEEVLADEPRPLRLWLRREDRAWREVNRMLAEIFQLDLLVAQFDAGKEGRKAESAVGGDGGDEGGGEGGDGPSGQPERKAPSATPEEQDLGEFFKQQPYFGPEDLGGG